MQRLISLFTLGALLTALVSPPSRAAEAQSAIVGINLLADTCHLPATEQESTLDTMKAAGVRFIRTSITDDDEGLAFARRIYAHGMQIELLLYPVARKSESTESRDLGSTGAGVRRWPGLSTFDPTLSKAKFESLFTKLDKAGFVLAAVELGNEINGTGFNSDFPATGEGRVLGGADLLRDPEGQKVATGYLQYLKILAVLKEVRDHSTANLHVPIITAGLVAAFDDTPIGKGQDVVKLKDTIDFLRANGADELVDGYAVHIYPPVDNLGKSGSAKRAALFNRIFDACGTGQKPFWVTEWGSVVGTTEKCPSPDGPRTALVREMRGHFRRLVQDGRLKGIFFYAWQGAPHVGHEDRLSAFRCGALTESGRESFAPL
ncbi:unnamed protein product [Sphagnum jensenii]